MGIAIHYGRVHIARFIADEESVQTTVIGRHVNLAGRLSSAAKAPIDEDEPRAAPPAASRGGVPGDGGRRRHAVQRGHRGQPRDAAAARGEPAAACTPTAQGTRHLEYFDEQIGRRLFIRYAGDAKFKGVRSSFPVYEVDFVH